MKKVITASTEVSNRTSTVAPSGKIPKRFFSPDDIVVLLQEIVELNGLEVFYEKTSDDNIAFTIGNNVYIVGTQVQ